MKLNLKITCAVAAILMTACKPKLSTNDFSVDGGIDSLQISASGIFQPLPKQADNASNPITPEKVALGKMLYYDTKLSMKGNNSCNSCHNLSTFGVDNKSFSIGDDGLPGGRNSPTVLNAALHATQFWDGRAKDVEEQAGMPIMNPVEMHMPSKALVEERLKKEESYKKLFAAAFPNDKNAVSYGNLEKAIGAFERTLMTPSKFDEYLAGKANALTKEEKDGLDLFMKTGCTTCHAGVVLGGQMFQKFGIYGNYWDLTKSAKVDSGRITVTKNASDLYVFKVPSLRNVEKTGPYFHDGSVADLNKAISIMAKSELNKTLSDNEVQSIASFLKTLTGTVPADAMKNPFQ
ncbi:MAG: cytochrome-c peroxidase [Chitinophagales bacterium]